MLGPHRPRRRPTPPAQHPPIIEVLQQVHVAQSSLTQSLVKHGSFVALYRHEVSAGNIDRGVGPLTPR